MNKLIHLPQLPGWVLSYAAHDDCWRLWEEVNVTPDPHNPDGVFVHCTLRNVEAASPETALLIQHPPGYDPKKATQYKQPDGGTK